MNRYYSVDGTTPEPDAYSIHFQDVDDHTIQTVLETVGGNLAPAAGAHGIARPKRTYVFRNMPEEEFHEVVRTNRMQYPTGSERNPQKGEKWFTESLQHSRQYDNAGRRGKPQVDVEFKLDKRGYQSDVKDHTIPQRGSKAKQPKEGRPFNVFNDERLKGHPRSKVNVGLKGRENVDMFNRHVLSVKKVDPHSFVNKQTVLRWIRRNKLETCAGILGVALDAAALTISIIEDGGEFGRETTLTVANIAGGAVGGAIGAAIGSLLPGIGTSVCSFVGAFIGSLIANGITSFFLGCNPTTPGPGQPLLDTDPREAVFGKQYLHEDLSPTFGQPSLGDEPGFEGYPDTEWQLDDNFPQMDYETG